MDGMLSLLVAESMWGLGCVKTEGSQQRSRVRKGEEFAEVGDSGWEPDAGASMVI